MHLAKLIVPVCVLALTIAGCADVGSTGGIGVSVKPGDLIFKDSDCGPLCDAIEKVTTGYQGANFSHVGIVAKDEHGQVIVLEAVSKGVVATDLRTFLITAATQIVSRR